jgi:hypothetical protein
MSSSPTETYNYKKTAGLAERVDIPETWLCNGKLLRLIIPSSRAGRYLRFEMDGVEKALFRK